MTLISQLKMKYSKRRGDKSAGAIPLMSRRLQRAPRTANFVQHLDEREMFLVVEA